MDINFETVIKSKIAEIRGVLQAESIFPDFLMRDDLKDEADVATGSVQNELKLNLTGLQRKRILALEEALSRLKNGHYGKCHNCEEPISEKRLRFVPESIYCIDCQAKVEKENRFRRSLI
jgi:RNA polymerase-binding protein DksA